MALWPNARHVARSPNRFFGSPPGLDVLHRGRSDRFNRVLAGDAGLSRWAATPDGYGMQAYVPPIRAGGMSSHARILDLVGSANLLNGAAISGTGSVAAVTGSAALSLIVALSGTFNFGMTGTANLALTIAMSGTGSMALTGSAALSLVVPFSGTGSVCVFSGAANLKGICRLSGSWTPFTELSPQGLAAAVWESAIESGYTATEVLRILAAIAAGKSADGGTTFRDLADTKDRVSGTVDGSGNRTAVTLDPT